MRGDTLAFLHKGDVFVATRSANWDAVQLTHTEGGELYPQVSPDGRQVAFLDPAGAVRVIQASGSIAKRLTFGPRALAVLGWKDNSTIAFASEEASSLPESYGLSFVDAKGGQPVHTGVQEIGFASFSDNGHEITFSRSLPSTGSQALFQGGKANQVVQMNLDNGKVRTPFSSPYSRMFAHQIGEDLYFVGTEGQGCLNLWRIRNKKRTRLTNFSIDGVRCMSADRNRLVYEQGGSLYSLDLRSGQAEGIPVRLKSMPEKDSLLQDLSESISELAISNNDTLSFVSRGKAYAMVDQNLRRLTTLEESAESHITFSKDGRKVALSVETPAGRWLYQWDTSSGKAEKLIALARDPSWMGWSPNGEEIFFSFDREAVYVLDQQRQLHEIGKLPRWTTSFSISNEGRYVGVTNASETKRTRLIVFDRQSKASYTPSDGRFEDIACAFDQSRSVLYLLSRRQGRPTLGGEFPDLNLSGGTVLIEIPTDAGSLSRPRSGKWIDLQGLSPTSISAASNGVWLHDESGDYKWNASTRTISKHKIPGTLDQFGARSVENSGSKVISHVFDEESGWRPGAEYSITGQQSVNLKAEWNTLFWGVHRFHAEQFYDPQFGGVDWNNVGKHYSQYLGQVTTRGELQSVLGRMTGELVGGHNGIIAPQDSASAAPQSRAPQSGMVVGWDGIGNRVLYVYRGRDDLPIFGSVSNPVEGKVRPGEYIRAVNGVRLNEHLGFDQVTCELGTTSLLLELANTIDGPSRQVQVTSPNRYLRYSDFLIRSEETVDRLSGNRIAYAHIFDTGSQGGGTFVDGFYGQTQKAGFLLDARWNRGGYSNPGFLNAFIEEPLFREVKRYGESLTDRPKIDGPIALLVNREAVSGGDLLAYAFKSRKIGLVVGTRTSGRTIGNQWYRGFPDGTVALTSESNNLDSKTLTSAGENVGVRPDIEVEIMPRLTFSVVDDQLIAAVTSLSKRLGKAP